MLENEESKHFIQEVALQNIDDGVFVFDKNRNISFYNPACEEIVGISKEEIVKNAYSCLDIFNCHTSDGSCLPLCPGLELFKGKRSRISREYLVRTKDNKEKWVITNYSTIRNRSGKIEYIVGIMRDITERKVFNDELLKYKTLSTLGQLSSELVHEIKNPLNSISIQMLLLERQINSAPNSKNELLDIAKVIKEEINRLNKLVKDCLEFSISGKLNRSYEDVNNIVIELVDLISPHADVNGIDIHLKTLLSCPKILIDKDKLKQALMNIVINAIEAMQGGGDIYMKVVQDKKYIKISIKNTGPKIPEDQRNKIFDLFYSTKSDGAGIGLGITQNIIHAHSGNVKYKNLKNGPEFIVNLPLT